jgi:AraC-like DNA-binding protein
LSGYISHLDSQIRAAQRVVNEITVNPKIYRFLEGSKSLNSMKRIELISVVGNLSALQNANNENLEQIYLYLPFYDMVVNSSSVYSTSLYYQYVENYDDMSYEQWLKLLAQRDLAELIVPLRQNGENIITFIYKLPISGQDCRVAIHLRADSMMNIMEEIAWANQSNIYILDRDGNTVISKISDESYPEPADALRGPLAGAGKDYFVNVISSNASNWKYLSVISRKALLSQADYMRVYSILLWIAGLVIGVLIALRFASWNAKPVKNIVKLISAHFGGDQQKTHHEFSYIANNFERLFSERQNFFDTLEQQKPLIQKSFFSELIKCKPEELGDLDFLPFQFCHGGFVVANYAIEDREMTQKDLNDVFISIYEVIHESGYAGYVFEESMRSVLLVLNVPMELGTSLKAALLPVLEKIRLCFWLREYKTVSIGVGGLKCSLRELYLSRQESQQAMKRKIILGHGAVIFSDDLRDEKARGHSFYSLDQEIGLMNSIRCGDYEQAVDIIDKIFNSTLEHIGGSPESATHFMINFMSTVIKAMNEMSFSQEDLSELGCDPRERLMKSSTVPALKQNTLHILYHVCRAVEGSKKSHNIRLKEQIIEYIDENYMNVDISVQQICEYVNISPSYLSRFFKENVGENLKRYLLRARVKKAKELLGETDRSVYEISKMVGYLNANTFIRVFKQQEGATPGQYREQKRCRFSAEGGSAAG